MSHFSKLKVQIKDDDLAKKTAKEFGWTIQREEKHINPWSKDTITNCQVLRDGTGSVKMVIAQNGDVIHDSYYMGREANKFLCSYSEAFIRREAHREGAMVSHRGVDAQGNTVLEVVYA